MTTNPVTSIFRVEDKHGYIRGTGFILSPALPVTCAHVVKACGALT